MKYNELTTEEKRVIEDKGTEAPFAGEYDKFFRKGVYLCRRCDALLYRSGDKFDSGCGWPSFDNEVVGAVKRKTDADGRRTEISCANCDAHLGHVFEGEKLTDKNVRHCVNSLSMRFVPEEFSDDEVRSVVLGGGCFWCLDSVYRATVKIEKSITGYAGGHKVDPTYDEVCAGNTGHAEVVKIEYDESKITFKEILEIFFVMHDPTTLNRQGNDVGEQYRSVIFYQTWNQHDEAIAMIEKLTAEKAFADPIVTEVRPMLIFYQAEEYHQDYYNKNPNNAYCQMVIGPKLEKLKI